MDNQHDELLDSGMNFSSKETVESRESYLPDRANFYLNKAAKWGKWLFWLSLFFSSYYTYLTFWNLFKGYEDLTSFGFETFRTLIGLFVKLIPIYYLCE